MAKKQLIESAFEAPARALDNAITQSEVATRRILSKDPLHDARAYWHTLGPGLTSGASDDDPSGIATYSQTGAQYGMQLLWLAPLTFPLMAIVQEMCARIGLATGRGLAGNIRKVYPKQVLYGITSLLFIANAFNLGADLGAMAKAVQLGFPNLNFIFIVAVFAVISLGLQIFTTYSHYARYLKYLSFVLLLYIITVFTIPGIDWGAVWHRTITPSITFSKDQLLLICAILGTTISPYLFFWQTSQEVEERQLSNGQQAHVRHKSLTGKEVHKMRIDVWSGMFLSNIVMYFIILTCAVTLFPNGIQISTAADAAAALQPLAGDQAYALFALGIIGTGMLAIPVLAGSASYALAETFRWKSGLYRKLKDAYAFYGVIIVAMAVGLLMNVFGIDPIKALIYSAVLNGLIAPIILFFVVRMSSNRQMMGHWANKPWTTFVGWLVVGMMALAGVAAIIAMF